MPRKVNTPKQAQAQTVTVVKLPPNMSADVWATFSEAQKQAIMSSVGTVEQASSITHDAFGEAGIVEYASLDEVPQDTRLAFGDVMLTLIGAWADSQALDREGKESKNADTRRAAVCKVWQAPYVANGGRVSLQKMVRAASAGGVHSVLHAHEGKTHTTWSTEGNALDC